MGLLGRRIYAFAIAITIVKSFVASGLLSHNLKDLLVYLISYLTAIRFLNFINVFLKIDISY